MSVQRRMTGSRGDGSPNDRPWGDVCPEKDDRLKVMSVQRRMTGSRCDGSPEKDYIKRVHPSTNGH
jgi:hypothetical protein